MTSDHVGLVLDFLLQVVAFLALSFDQIAPYVTFRSGQNAIVELIVQILAEAERGPAQPRGK